MSDGNMVPVTDEAKHGVDTGFLSSALIETGVFDAAWYADRYPDVAQLGINPLTHFIRYGFWMDRDPGPRFSRTYYADKNKDVVLCGLDPLVHYLKHGLAEGRTAAPPVPVATRRAANRRTTDLPELPVIGNVDQATADLVAGWAVDPLAPGEPVALRLVVDDMVVLRFSTSLKRQDVSRAGHAGERAGFKLKLPRGLIRKGQRMQVVVERTGGALRGAGGLLERDSPRGHHPLPVYLLERLEGSLLPVTVVVPVYNARDAVRDCLESLQRTLPSWARVLVIDDASPDPGIGVLLEAWSDLPSVTVVRNKENIGYTRTINKAISLAPGEDVVLLNSDTVVTHRWLHNMRYCAYAQPRTATVTALSDNSGAFSVPVMGTFNPVPEHLSPPQAALAVTRDLDGIGLPVPTGNGFCMYIRRSAIDAIGTFDEERFPRGYGEENDFCMRALHAGWRNMVCDKTYVFHKRSQSFQGEKGVLMEAGGQAVREKYPEYKSAIARFSDIEFTMLRGRVQRHLDRATRTSLLPRVLFVISTQTGGTPQTNLDLMRAVSGHYEGWLLRSDGARITLMRLQDDRLVDVEARDLRDEIEPYTHRSLEYDRIVLDMIHRYSIDLLHIRHIAWHSLGLSQVARELDIPVICSLHDFYTLCYSVNLLSEDGVFRGATMDGRRVNPLWPSHPMPEGFVSKWRENMRGFLVHCDQFVTTADSAAKLVAEAYPELDGRINVIPHGRDFSNFCSAATVPLRGERLRVLVPGNISDSKGAALIEKIEEIDGGATVEFHFLGNTIGRLKGVGVHHGAYGREEFADRVKDISPHLGVVLSVWPETYCHTLTEMWACGIPVLAIDLGAVGDRIRVSGGGWLVEPCSEPEKILGMLRGVAADQEGFIAKLQLVRDWQLSEGVWNSTAEMASRYRGLYHQALNKASGAQKRIGLVVRHMSRGRFPPTAHIRVLGPMAAIGGASGFDTRHVTVPWLLAGGVERLDGVIIQRDAVSAADAPSLIDALRLAGVPWMYEIDDALWEITTAHSDHSIDEAQEQAILRIARGAALVTCSTPALAARIQEFAPRVMVVPNAHDDGLWRAPVELSFAKAVCADFRLDDARPRLLYMGSRSHAEDLDLVMDAVWKLQERFPELEVVQIGGGRLLPMAREIERPESLFNYTDFVPWFRAICSACTFAISPLRDTAFNRYKSDIKHLDYALAGLPAVFSRVGPYQESVQDGVTGLLVENRTEAWLEAMTRMVEDEVLRGSIREAARASARTLQGSGVMEQWQAALEEAFGRR